MPKVVDHEQRRRGIAEVVLRIVAADGVAAATLRRVAAESGHAMGTIQHYFHTTRQMLQYAIALQEKERAERIGARARAEWESGPRAVLEGIMDEVLPTGGPQRQEAAVGLAYYIAWHRHPELKESLFKDIPAARAAIASVIADAQQRGLVDEGVEPDLEASVFFALIDALASAVAVGHQSPEEALATARYHLDRVFTTRPST